MRKPTTDFKKDYKSFFWLFGWVGYFILYILTENLIPLERHHVVHGALDDVIPFCEYFIIPYTFWYFLIVFSLGYFALYNIKSFVNLQKYLIVTQIVAMAVYIIWPSIQLLRPDLDAIGRDNAFIDIIKIIYTVDTPTGVCPSLHVGYSIGILSVWVREKGVSVWWKAFVVFACLTISISVAFVKQHSVVDIYAAIPLCLLAEAVVYGKGYLQKLKRHG